ncbi:hypothetical protein FHT71_003687 [Rhizobium sp. BK060]|nr:hypothetical protein [Rhizobium sp. BK060]
MYIRTPKAAFPALRRVRSDIADNIRTAPRAYSECLGEGVQRSLGESKRLQPFMGEPDIDRKPGPMLPLSRIHALEHVAQPCSRLRPVVEPQENVTPVSQENRRHDIVLDVVKVGL